MPGSYPLRCGRLLFRYFMFFSSTLPRCYEFFPPVRGLSVMHFVQLIFCILRNIDKRFQGVSYVKHYHKDTLDAPKSVYTSVVSIEWYCSSTSATHLRFVSQMLF